LIATRLLGRHVGDGAHAANRARDIPLGIVKPGEAEIRELDLALWGQPHVVGFHISMHEPVIVRSAQRLGDGQRDLEELAGRHRSRQRRIAQRVATHPLEHEEGATVRRRNVVNLQDVRMIQRGECLGLACELRQRVGILRVRLVEHLERDVSITRGIRRAIHVANSARAEWRDDGVGTELRAEWQSAIQRSLGRTLAPRRRRREPR
jgi:hypothetical protein